MIMSDNDERDFFREMMADVAPIQQDTVTLSAQHHTTEAQLARRLAAQTLSDSDPDYLSLDYANML